MTVLKIFLFIIYVTCIRFSVLTVCILEYSYYYDSVNVAKLIPIFYKYCIIDDENELAMLRKQTIEKDKKTVKSSKSVCEYSQKNKTKRQSVCSVRYSPPLDAGKKITSRKKQRARNMNVSI